MFRVDQCFYRDANFVLLLFAFLYYIFLLYLLFTLLLPCVVDLGLVGLIRVIYGFCFFHILSLCRFNFSCGLFSFLFSSSFVFLRSISSYLRSISSYCSLIFCFIFVCFSIFKGCYLICLLGLE